jgi:hypothetical protein
MAIRTLRTDRPAGSSPFVRRAWVGIATLMMTGSCTAPVILPPMPQARQATARPAPVATRAAVAATAPAAVPARTQQTGWQDLPIAPGEWRWSREGGNSTARFNAAGQARALLSCRGGVVTLDRYGSTDPANAAPTVIVRTTSATRPTAGIARNGSVSMSLAANDPLLDAIAFSRGRFAIEVPGMAPLPLPSWPEVARVIDDCRG